MNKIILILMMVISTSINAKSTEEVWSVYENQGRIDEGIGVMLRLDANCYPFISQYYYMEKVKVFDGQSIKWGAFDKDYYGDYYGYATTIKGREFTLSKFKNQNSVVIGKDIFTAKGFTKTLNTLVLQCKNKKKYEEDAL